MTKTNDNPGASNVPPQNSSQAGAAGAGDTAAAGAAAPRAAQEKPGGPQPQSDGSTANSDNLYRPAGLPDHMVGTSDKETIDKLAKVVEGYRKAQANSGVPESAEGYRVDLPDEVKNVVFKFDENGRDPVWDALTPVFHERGLSNEDAMAMVSKLAEVLPGLSQQGMDADGGDDDADFEYKSYGGPEKARAHVDGVTAWAKALVQQGVLDDDDLSEVAINTSSGKGLKLMTKLRVAMGGEPIPSNIDGGDAGGGMDEAKLHAMMKDPRYWKARDQAYIAEVTEGFRKLYNPQG